MLKVLLIEDEPLAIEQLEIMVLQWDSTCKIVGRIESLEEGILWFENHSWPDIIISDIQLSDGLSLDLFKEGVPDTCKIIFTTAYDQYAIDAFKIQAQDYLLKPIDEKAFTSVLEKVKNMRLQEPHIDYALLSDLVAKKLQPKNKVFLIRFNNQLIDIPSTKVAFFFISNRQVLACTFDERKLPLDESLDQIEQELDPNTFFRANRKCIINYHAIRKMKSYSNSKLLLESEPRFPEDDIIISKEKGPIFKSWLSNRKI
jgi:DNA-binding LytR/AlgR family response regulator